MRRLTILLATAMAFMAVSVAQAAAAPKAIVKATGNGVAEFDSGYWAYPEVKGEVFYEKKYSGEYEGTPKIACTYKSPGPVTGVCENEMSEIEEGVYAIFITAVPGAGGEFAGWTIEEGIPFEPLCEPEPESPKGGFSYGAGGPNGERCLLLSFGEDAKVTANFTSNLRTLTVTKSPSSSVGGGNGSVSSKPKGIKCGATCDEAVARLYKEGSVELTAKPSTGSTFVEWEGGDCDESKSTTCVIGMDKDETTEAVFGGTSKAFSPAEELVVSKGSSSGKGTVKAAGLGCEADCSSTTVLYQGPITEPKAKAGKVVILKQAPAFGSKFVGWTGCDSETEAGECVVAMETDKEVIAKYEALLNRVLTVNKSYASGNGSVASKPKGIKCATTCTQAVASMPEGAAVELVAKPTTGTFKEWVGGDCNGSTSTTCVVTMNKNETTEAVFTDPGKAIANAQTLTLNKKGFGFGTVKASGLTCEVLCSASSALYTGPITEPKAKPGKVVVLKATSAPGSKAVQWTGCDSNPTPGECVVEMDEAHTVSATFDNFE